MQATLGNIVEDSIILCLKHLNAIERPSFFCSFPAMYAINEVVVTDKNTHLQAQGER